MPPDQGRFPSEMAATTDTEDWRNQGLEEKSPKAELQPWPEESKEGNSYDCLFREFQKWTYSYMDPLLRKGSKQTLEDGTHLTEGDLFAVPRSMKSEYLVVLFNERYQELKGQKHRLVKTLWRLSAKTFIPAGFCQLATVLCQVTIPLLVRELLNVLEENPGQNVIRAGMPFAVGIFLASFCNALGNHRHRHLATKTGVVMRAAVNGVIYERVLRLSPLGKAGLTSGEVSTLVAIDSQKLFEVTQEAHLTWSMPLSVTLVTISLLIIMGPTTLVGLAILMMFVPAVERIASYMVFYRHKRVQITDRRVGIVSSMLQGIKVTKLNNYEENYKERIESARDEEHALLRRELAWWAVSLVVTVTSPVLASAGTFATFVLVSEDNILTSAQTFTVLLLFIALRFPISYTGRLIGKASQALDSLRRIDEFVGRELRPEQSKDSDQNVSNEPEAPSEKDDDSPVLVVKNGVFRFGRSEPLESETLGESTQTSRASKSIFGFEVSGIDFSLRRGQVLAVVGPVGSGKSTLINGIMGEVPSTPDTHVSTKGTVAYVSQTAFILNETVRANILFGLRYDDEWYNKVLDACCLRPDLEQLGEAGDLAEIGERGVTLSGGQKQRVSLARAAYARPDLVLMDDPISALDAGTSKKIFDRLIKSPSTSILSKSAIVLVTHAAHFLNRVDSIMVMVEGEAKFLGTWADLSGFTPNDQKTGDAIEYIRSSVQEEAEIEGGGKVGPKNGKVVLHDDDDPDGKKDNGKVITVEEREHGLSSLKTWLLWFKYAGGVPFILMQFLLLTLDRLAYVASEYWLARWTQGAYDPVNVFGREFPAQTDGISAQYQYLTVYASIVLLGIVFTLSRSEWAVTGGARCSKNVFLNMLQHVMKAPLSYFETTPIGRILNRFTYDMEVIDHTLTESMSILMIASSWFTAGVIIMLTIMPWIAFALVPALFSYYLLLLHYRRSGTDLQRIDAVARSPMQAIVAEGLEGSMTIRVFEQVDTFVANFFSVSDDSSSALLNFISAQRWIGVRIEIIGSFVVFCSCTLVVTLHHTLELESGIVALLIIWTTNFTITIGFLVDYFAEGEAAITSIERVDAMTTIAQEKSMITDPEHQLDPSWPEKGMLEFKDVCLRYRKGLPLALNKLSFTIPPGKRCGVVGRTGAGKSSLTAALFRLLEIESGSILLDGVDLCDLGLSDVRGRANGMAIIPQDPFIAGTTLRSCLDPFGSATDEQVLEALAAVRLKDALLDDVLSEGGSNFSVGERQLLNLARALLFQPKLLVLDEATASIDGETDAFIQRMLRVRFKDTTLVTVAHRLNTIMDYDVILVMDAGQAAEMGPPLELLNRNGMFAELVNATGVESARALREIAEAAEKKGTID